MSSRVPARFWQCVFGNLMCPAKKSIDSCDAYGIGWTTATFLGNLTQRKHWRGLQVRQGVLSTGFPTKRVHYSCEMLQLRSRARHSQFLVDMRARLGNSPTAVHAGVKKDGIATKRFEGLEGGSAGSP